MAEDTNGHTYPSHPRATVNRLRKRAHYDFATIHSIIDRSTVVHVAFPPAPANADTGEPADPFPAILPMIGCTGDFAKYGSNPEAEYAGIDDPASPEADEAKDVYLHGYVTARLFRNGRNSSNGDEEGLPVSIGATLVTGLKYALAPFHNSYNYRSATVFGWAVEVTDAAERDYALRRITDSVTRGRWDASRMPVTNAEGKATGVLRVRVASAAAKRGSGQSVDDRADMKNDALRESVWTGVIPVVEHLGPPVAHPENKCKQLPKYMQDEIDRRNAMADAMAAEDIKRQLK